MKKNIKLFIGLMGVFLFLVVFLVNPSIANEKKYKTLSFEEVLKSKEDFSKGSFKNVKIKEENNGISLFSGQVEDGEYTTPLIEAPFKATHLGIHLKKDGEKNDFFEIQVRSGESPNTLGEWRKVQIMEEVRDGIEDEEDFSYLQSVWGDKFAQAKIIFKNEKKDKQKLNRFTLTFIDALNEIDSTKKLTFAPSALAQSVINYFTKKSPHNQEINIISREEWGADESLRENASGGEDWPRSYHGTRKIVIHHTGDAGSNGVTDIEKNMATMRGIYEWHAVTNNWGDIGYNAVVDAAGNIYEGRYGTPGEDFKRTEVTAEDVMVLDVEGAHVSSYNGGSFGVSAMGDFSSFDLPDAQRESVKKTMAFVADSRGINIQGNSDFLKYDGNWHENLNNVFTHRDVASTLCPGDKFYNEVTNIKTETDNFPEMPSNLDGFSATINGNDIEGAEIGTGIIEADWGDFYGASGYNYALEKVFGTIYDPQPYETAWMNFNNTKYSAFSQISIDTSLLDPNSQYVLYVVAVDPEGKAISTVEHLNFKTNDLLVLDTTIPEVTITSPIDGYEVSEKERLIISASASDNVKVTRIEIFLGEKNVITCENTESCEGKVLMFKEPDGEYIVKAIAYDEAGNQNLDEITIQKGNTGSTDPEPDPEPEPEPLPDDGKPEKCNPWPTCRTK